MANRRLLLASLLWAWATLPVAGGIHQFMALEQGHHAYPTHVVQQALPLALTAPIQPVIDPPASPAPRAAWSNHNRRNPCRSALGWSLLTVLGAEALGGQGLNLSSGLAHVFLGMFG